ncbi:MAG: hypothetical protein RLY93_01900 [Sumerlaeia bacterium]
MGAHNGINPGDDGGTYEYNATGTITLSSGTYYFFGADGGNGDDGIYAGVGYYTAPTKGDDGADGGRFILRANSIVIQNNVTINIYGGDGGIGGYGTRGYGCTAIDTGADGGRGGNGGVVIFMCNSIQTGSNFVVNYNGGTGGTGGDGGFCIDLVCEGGGLQGTVDDPDSASDAGNGGDGGYNGAFIVRQITNCSTSMPTEIPYGGYLASQINANSSINAGNGGQGGKGYPYVHNGTNDWEPAYPSAGGDGGDSVVLSQHSSLSVSNTSSAGSGGVGGESPDLHGATGACSWGSQTNPNADGTGGSTSTESSTDLVTTDSYLADILTPCEGI